jgi:hypothetical protein
MSTLHTLDASETINRIIDFFPPHQQQQARAMIAGTLKGIVSQRLVRTADGKGRVACCEIMVMTGRVRDMILDPQLTGQLPEVIAEGVYYGMQTFDQHLLQHLQAGRVTMEDAMRVATSPHDFKLMVAAAGKPKGEGQAQGPGYKPPLTQEGAPPTTLLRPPAHRGARLGARSRVVGGPVAADAARRHRARGPSVAVRDHCGVARSVRAGRRFVMARRPEFLTGSGVERHEKRLLLVVAHDVQPAAVQHRRRRGAARRRRRCGTDDHRGRCRRRSQAESWVYSSVVGPPLVGRRDQVFLMTKVCTHGRGNGGDAAAPVVGEAVATDISPGMLHKLEDSARELGLSVLDAALYVVGLFTVGYLPLGAAASLGGATSPWPPA